MENGRVYGWTGTCIGGLMFSAILHFHLTDNQTIIKKHFMVLGDIVSRDPLLLSDYVLPLSD